MLHGLPQLQKLFTAATQFELTDLVWEILGGFPSRYELLNTHVFRAEDLKKGFEEFLMKELRTARTHVRNERRSDDGLIHVFDKIKAKDTAHAADLEEIKRPTPDKLLFKDGHTIYPANAAIAFVIKHDLYKMPELPSFTEIKAVADAQRKIDKKQDTAQTQVAM